MWRFAKSAPRAKDGIWLRPLNGRIAEMKIFIVRFKGYNPIGAVAIVLAEDSVLAHELFMDTLQDEEPFLLARNTTSHLAVQLEQLADIGKSDLLPVCEILNNGDY